MIKFTASYIERNSNLQGLQNTLNTVGKEVGGMLKGLTKVGAKALNKVLDHPTLVSTILLLGIL